MHLGVKATMMAVNPAIIQSFSFSATVTAVPKLNVYNSIEFERDILKLAVVASSLLDAEG